VLAEVLVFNGNEGGFHQWWDLIVSNDDSVLLSKGADHGRVVVGINLGDHRRSLVVERCHLRQVAAVDEQNTGGGPNAMDRLRRTTKIKEPRYFRVV
jgi:hypothetical protein